MDDAVVALAAQRDELVALVGDLDEGDLGRPSRCEGWTVADVLLHLAQTDDMAVASVEGRLPQFIERIAAGIPPTGDVDAWAGALVDHERGAPTESRDRYVAASRAQVDAFASVDPSTRVLWVAGELAARSLAATRLTETWIHTVDVATAFGAEPAPTARLWHTVRLAWRTLPYAFARAGREMSGAVGFELTAPDGTTWSFGMDEDPSTVVRGSAHELCTVAGQRADADTTGLSATGPDSPAVLELVRTFA